MAEHTPEPEPDATAEAAPRHGGGPALPRKPKTPVTYAKGPAPDSIEGGGGGRDSAAETGADGPSLPRKQAGGSS